MTPEEKTNLLNAVDEINKEATEAGFDTLVKQETYETEKDKQIEALAYLLIAICLPTIKYYQAPKRHSLKHVEYAQKAFLAEKLLKKAGF